MSSRGIDLSCRDRVGPRRSRLSRTWPLADEAPLELGCRVANRLWITSAALPGFGHAVAVSIAVSTITDRIRRRVLLEGIDLGGDRARAADIAREEVRGYAEEALGSSLPLVHDEESTTREVLARVTGFGVLQPYLDDPEIEEIWINAPS